MLRGAFLGAATSTFPVCYFSPLNRLGVASGAQALEIHFQKNSLRSLKFNLSRDRNLLSVRRLAIQTHRSTSRR